MANSAASPERCDGLDNDCDGDIDEDSVGGLICDTGLLGDCAVGELICAGGVLTCSATTLPGALTETCNGKDDDCDGEVDESSCDDGNPCTDDACVEGECVFEPDDDDENECSEQCIGGTCGRSIDLLSGEYAPESGRWALGARWEWYATSLDPYLHGSWGDYSVGCPVSSAARLMSGVDLTGATHVELRFSSLATVGEEDFLGVSASLDGATWSSIASVFRSSTWVPYVIDLSAYAGEPSVQLELEFDNECSDTYGVDWSIDELQVVIEAAEE